MTVRTVARPALADKLLAGLSFADQMVRLSSHQGRVDTTALVVAHTLEALPTDTPVGVVLALLSTTDIAAKRGQEQ